MVSLVSSLRIIETYKERIELDPEPRRGHQKLQDTTEIISKSDSSDRGPRLSNVKFIIIIIIMLLLENAATIRFHSAHNCITSCHTGNSKCTGAMNTKYFLDYIYSLAGIS